MTKRPDIKTVASGYMSQETINTNFENIKGAFDNTLSRDGSTPNTMEADLDLNGYNILNVGDLSLGGGDTLNELVTSVETSATNAATSASEAETAKGAAEAAQAAAEAAENSLLEWQGAWTTSTSYAPSDIVRESGSSYICLEAHTSGTFSTDLSAGKWEIFAQQGAAGAGTGDMLAANNLSDVVDADTSLSNLGGTTVGQAVFKAASEAAARTAISAQESDATLTALGGTLTAANKIPYATALDTAGELDFVDEDDMASNSATAVPSQQSVKAYVDAASSPIAVLSETDISSAASHDIVLDTTNYNWFQVVLSHMRPNASADTLVAQVSTDGGSTFKSGASDYAWHRIRHVYYSADVSDGDASDSSIQVSEVVGGAASQAGLSGIINIIHPQNASRKTSIRFQGELEAGDGSFQTVESGGQYKTAGAVNAIRLKFATNNILTGKVIVYGYKGA